MVSYFRLFDPRENFTYPLFVGLLIETRLEMRRREFLPLERKEIIIAVIHISSKAEVVLLMSTQVKLAVSSTG